jgi:hypothetical protein
MIWSLSISIVSSSVVNLDNPVAFTSSTCCFDDDDGLGLPQLNTTDATPSQLHCTLQHRALGLLLGLLLTTWECGPWHAGLFRCLVLVANRHCDCHVEDVLYAVLLFRTALHVHGAHLLGDSAALLWGYGCEALGLEQLDAVPLVAEVGFEAEEHDGCRGAEVEDLRVPLDPVSSGKQLGVYRWTHLVHNVFQRVGAVNGKADEEDVGFGVRERPQSIVLLLSGGIPEGKLDHLACGRVRCVCNVVLEDGGYVFLRTVSLQLYPLA